MFRFPMLMRNGSCHSCDVSSSSNVLLRNRLAQAFPKCSSQFLTKATMSSFRCRDRDVNDNLNLIFTHSQIHVPLSIVGTTTVIDEDSKISETPDERLVIHSPGLPGAFAMNSAELLKCNQNLQLLGNVEEKEEETTRAVEDTEQDKEAAAAVEDQIELEIGARCLHSAVANALGKVDPKSGCFPVLKELRLCCMSKSSALRGLENLLRASDRVNPSGLILDFSYYAIMDKPNTTLKHFDISDDACSAFSKGIKHGDVMLSSNGAAVCVGVAPCEELGNQPALFWHPFGVSAACICPMMHASGLRKVGEMKLQRNGPGKGLGQEICDGDQSLRKYLSTSCKKREAEEGTVEGEGCDRAVVIDTTSSNLLWDLFSMKVGDKILDGKFSVLGLGCDRESENILDVFLKSLNSGDNSIYQMTDVLGATMK